MERVTSIRPPDLPAATVTTASLFEAMLFLAVLLLAACASTEQADSDDADRQTNVEMPHPLTFGASAVVSSLIKPVKEPVSTVGRVTLLGLDLAVDLVAMPFRAVGASAGTGKVATASGGRMDLAEWERTLDGLTGTRLTHGTVRFLVDGEAFYPVLRQAIDGAVRSVDVRLYIFDTDDVALGIADSLRRRSESADVRVLLDGLGSAWASGVRPESLPEDHRAPVSITQYLRQESRVEVRVQANPMMAGDHVKSIIVDGERAFLGGMNIGREYRYEWHDMMVELRGPAVAEVRRDFDATWSRASLFGDLAYLIRLFKGMTTRNEGDGVAMRLLTTGPGADRIRRARLAAFDRAQDRIFVETPYLSDRAAVDGLVAAARRGVDVRVILPEENDAAMMAEANRAAARVLLDAGARVFVYPGFTHAKAMLVDGWALFGSSNMDWFSHVLNRELDIATSDPDIAARLERVLFRPDFERSVELRPDIPAPTIRQLAATGTWS